MKNKRNRWKWNRWTAGAVMMMLLLAVLPVQKVQAASATITLSTDTEEIRVGDTVEVKLTIRADATIGDVEAFIRYDDSVLEFYSAVSCITGGAGMLKVADIGASPSQQDRTYRIYFTALDAGDCEIVLYDRPIVYGYTDGAEMSVSGFSKTITVLPAITASENSNLSALHLVDNRNKTVELTPVFSSETQIYYAAVPFSSERLIVSAIAMDEKANVEVSGSRVLEVGNNEVFVTVTAENGSQTIYTVYVFRSETDDAEETEVKEPEAVEQVVLPEPGIVFETSEETVLVTEYHTYTACEKPDTLKVPDGYVQTTLMIGDIPVTAYVKQEVSAEEFLLLVLSNEAGEVNWYRYDRVEQTLQRVNQEEFIVTQVIEQNDESLKEAIKQYEVQQIALIIGVAILFGISLVLLMIIVWLCIRRKNRG